MLALEQAKTHIRVDGDDEDALILKLIAAAEAAVLQYLGLPELPDAPPIEAAVAMLMASLYMNRESQSDRPIIENHLFMRLLDPYRVMVT